MKTRPLNVPLRNACTLAILTTLMGSCGTVDPVESSDRNNPDTLLGGEILLDGSSTVFPVSEAMAEEFQKLHPGVRINVGISGTGGGFRKFCADETDITGASRPITPSEIELCQENGVEFIELPIAMDGLSIVVNPDNDFAQCLTLAELKMMWEPAAQGSVMSWRQIRPDFPDGPLGLYAPGVDSGTYDYFMETIGTDGESRGDFTASEDDNVLVQGVANNLYGLAFFGFAYYEQNQDRLKLVAIDDGNGNCIEPSPETIADDTYNHFSRPEFIYVKKAVADRPEVKEFVEFYLDFDNKFLIKEAGYVPLPEAAITKALERFHKGEVGSEFK
ncbi:PstS family phosphate ABC transporter substrate-binding protein [Spirulina sp. CCNP1310]|uniref:PstS family phosphate ABC transporter substrate-binding protein n=1 Tax=Spirulina sp. CCNP1310 TaxID=3110249 RepID=UPI002B21AEB5|nr:PstS family phosphate ABC transporter substrate-binding protein [Spirulina sp. CCNP1310]MEA5419576.1 PstS family phosphate ABC transporter substrate-binding protein [Spirulina sp. CCNP1310]